MAHGRVTSSPLEVLGMRDTVTRSGRSASSNASIVTATDVRAGMRPAFWHG